MLEQEISKLNEGKTSSPKDFIDNNFSWIRKDLRTGIIEKLYSYRSNPYERHWSKEFRDEILSAYSAIENLEPQPTDSRPITIYKRNLHIGAALSRYIKTCVEGPSMGWDEFGKNKYTSTFLTAYKILGSKDGIRMASIIEEMRDYDLVDDEFWRLVSGVKIRTNERITGYFARRLFNVKWYGRLWEKDIDLINFSENYIRVSKIGNDKTVAAFCQGTINLIKLEVPKFDGLASLSIEATKRIEDENLAYWATVNGSLLEKECFDYTGSQLVGDISWFQKRYGKKAVWGYVYGVSGILKEREEREGQLAHEKWTLQKVDENPNWYIEELRQIKEAMQKDKEGFGLFLEKESLEVKRNRIATIREVVPQLEKEIPFLDPLIFRQNFVRLLEKAGLSEAWIYARAWTHSFKTHYIKEEKRVSDVKYLLDLLPDILINFKNKVSKRVYSTALFAAPRVSCGAVWILRNFLDGVVKCYALRGEKTTLGRIRYTLYRAKNRKGVAGLERHGKRQVYRTHSYRDWKKKIREWEKEKDENSFSP